MVRGDHMTDSGSFRNIELLTKVQGIACCSISNCSNC